MAPKCDLRFEKSPVLWHRDGDIVIQARRSDRDVYRCLKVYRQVLAVHAPYFLELVDRALSKDVRRMGNTPAVSTSENALQLEWLLQALHQPSILLWEKHKSTNFKRALPLYKLALKYKVDHVTEVLKAQLTQDWPRNIWEWDMFEADDVWCNKAGFDTYFDLYPEPAAAIQFARMADLPGLLPAAFYQLSRVAPADDYNGRHRSTYCPMSGRRSARWSDLTKEDLLCLEAGKSNLAFCMDAIQNRLSKEIPAEETKCRAVWELMPLSRSDDILHDLLEICKPDRLPGAYMCSDCREKVNKRAREQREWVWCLLPECFRLI